MLDRVVSSYTPTLRSLTLARERAEQGPTTTPLILSLPSTPGLAPLAGAITEREVLEELLGTRGCHTLCGADATGEKVVSMLGSHTWFHASCHGTQRLGDPSAGGLLPYDWQENGLIDIATLTDTAQNGGEFAFLSACMTAVGGTRVPEESITLAAALQYSGWRHVIGTQWSVWDSAAAEVSDRLYRRLICDGTLDTRRTAESLHAAVRELRDARPGEPSSWGPFIHLGP